MAGQMKDILNEAKGYLQYLKSVGVTEVNMVKKLPKDECEIFKDALNLHKNLDSEAQLKTLREEIGDCNHCKLCSKRTNIVFGVGNPNAELMFIGEGPGGDEDEQGIPFVGRAGQLLTKIIEAMNYKREEVYIANIVKCRPPNNRNPEPDEVSSCIGFLIKQVEIVKPKVIVCLGSVATRNLLQTEDKITKIRGNFTNWQGIPVMPTYHPAFLLRNPNMKKPVWEDMQKVMGLLGKNKTI